MNTMYVIFNPENQPVAKVKCLAGAIEKVKAHGRGFYYKLMNISIR